MTNFQHIKSMNITKSIQSCKNVVNYQQLLTWETNVAAKNIEISIEHFFQEKENLLEKEKRQK